MGWDVVREDISEKVAQGKDLDNEESLWEAGPASTGRASAKAGLLGPEEVAILRRFEFEVRKLDFTQSKT